MVNPINLFLKLSTILNEGIPYTHKREKLNKNKILLFMIILINITGHKFKS